MVSPGQMRVSDAERDEVLERLRTALGEGRLDADEFSERTGTTLAARTFDDLHRITVDLPAAPSRPLVGATLTRAGGRPQDLAPGRRGGWPAPLSTPFGQWLVAFVLGAAVLGLVFGGGHHPFVFPLLIWVFFMIRRGVRRGPRR